MIPFYLLIEDKEKVNELSYTNLISYYRILNIDRFIICWASIL